MSAFIHERASELHPQAAEMLASAAESDRPNAHLLPVEEARRNFDADFEAAGPGESVESVEDVRITVDGGEVPSRVYRPAPGELPVVAYFHGGGWLLGSIESHDAVCRGLANASGAVVVSVGYRRGPEHRFPTAVEDCRAAVGWIVGHAGELGVDAGRLAVAGDSAGGNLATAVTIAARSDGGPPIAFQLLAYPVTTMDLDKGFDSAYEGFFLFRDELQWHQDNYLRSPDDRDHPLVAPLDAADLKGLPPAMVITAQCDPLHAQGELYAAALAEAGVEVEHTHRDGMVHGFFQLPGVFEDGQATIRRSGAALRAAFGSGPEGT